MLHPVLDLLGEVVGVEQVHQCLRFTVAFDADPESSVLPNESSSSSSGHKIKEFWTGAQVRSASLKYEARIRCSDEVFECDGVPALPPGYKYEDIDIVCGFARGYSGWGGSANLVPLCISRLVNSVTYTLFLHHMLHRGLTLIFFMFFLF